MVHMLVPTWVSTQVFEGHQEFGLVEVVTEVVGTAVRDSLHKEYSMGIRKDHRVPQNVVFRMELAPLIMICLSLGTSIPSTLVST